MKRMSQVVDMLHLMGDAVDNIPGIPGVGEKTAAKLLAEYDNMENILANADKIKGALGEKIRNNREMAVMSKKLATIVANVPVPFHAEDFRVKEKNEAALKEVFDELEFRTIMKRIFGTAPEQQDIWNGGKSAGAKGNVAESARQSTDLFGNPVKQKKERAGAACSRLARCCGRDIDRISYC